MVALRDRTGEFIVPFAPLTHKDAPCLAKEFMRHWRYVRLSPHPPSPQSRKRKLPDAATPVTTVTDHSAIIDSRTKRELYKNIKYIIKT